MILRQKSKPFLVLGLAYVSLLASCKDQGNFTGGANKKGAEAPAPEVKAEVFTIGKEGVSKVDIAFFMDTSDSMAEEYTALIAGFQGFIDKIATGDSGLDYQLFILGNTSKFRLSLTNQKLIDVRNSEVNSHSGLWNAYHFLEGNTDKVPSGKLSLRSDATKELVFLTDDDAQGITASNFLPYLRENQTKLGPIHINGFVGLPTSQTTSTCKIAKQGLSYMTLGSDPTFGGEMADVCSSNWTDLLGDLAEQVRGRAGKSLVLTLKGKPTDESKISVMVDGQIFKDFTYDKQKNRVTLDGTKVAGGTHTVKIGY